MCEVCRLSVEICDDLACVILNESGQALANAVLECVDKKPKKCTGFIVEQYQRYNPNNKWWTFELNKNDCDGPKCDQF